MTIDRRAFLTLGTAFGALTLSACSFGGGPPPLTFDLNAADPKPVRRRTRNTVVITQPKTVDTYSTARVVVRDAGDVLSYLPDAQLSDTLPQLVQTRMLQTFENARFPNIGRPDDQLRVDVTLATEIRAFEIDVREGSVARVTLGAKLVNERVGEIFASRVFSAAVPTPSNPPAAAIAGLNQALEEVTIDILGWTAANA